MRKSIDPMRRPEAAGGPLRALIVSMSFQPVIPWRVAPQQSPPPLPRPVIVSEKRLALETFFQRTATCPHLRCLTTGVQPRKISVTVTDCGQSDCGRRSSKRGHRFSKILPPIFSMTYLPSYPAAPTINPYTRSKESWRRSVAPTGQQVKSHNPKSESAICTGAVRRNHRPGVVNHRHLATNNRCRAR